MWNLIFLEDTFILYCGIITARCCKYLFRIDNLEIIINFIKIIVTLFPLLISAIVYLQWCELKAMMFCKNVTSGMHLSWWFKYQISRYFWLLWKDQISNPQPIIKQQVILKQEPDEPRNIIFFFFIFMLFNRIF